MKSGFTDEQHQRHGAALLAAHSALEALWKDGMKAYPIDSPIYRSICRAGKAVDGCMFRIDEDDWLKKIRPGAASDSPYYHDDFIGWG